MTKEKMRIKIAEILGWKWGCGDVPYWDKGVEYCWRNPEKQVFAICFLGGRTSEEAKLDHIEDLPNYPEDLNACRDFEQTLRGLEIGYYMDWIVPSKIKWMTGEAPWSVCHASALQRCEAFLRVHNAWEEDEAE